MIILPIRYPDELKQAHLARFLQPCQVSLLQHVRITDAAGGHHWNIDILITIQHDNAVLIYKEDNDDL